MDAEIVVTLGETKAELIKEPGRKYLTKARGGRGSWGLRRGSDWR